MGEVFWRALLVMLVSDPSNLVAFSCVRAIFGEPQPHAENLRKRCVG